LLEGPLLLEEAERAGVKVREIFSLDDFGTRVTQEALDRISTVRTPQSPVAVVEIPERPLTPGRDALVAWDIADPGNLGTMIRTAAAFRFDFMATPGATDIWAPKVIRAAAGSHFHTGLGDVALAGYTALAAVSAGGQDFGNIALDGPVAVLIGNEAHGLPDDVVSQASFAVTIPMPGRVESLNAAIAAAILCYEVAKRRTVGGELSPGERSS
jgi:TrmH family RNA methyltransferase